MHYYQFNIGDYIANTARLSNLEDLCYRRLLDLYYLNEQPFNECSNSVAREIGFVEQIEIVEFILNKYFQLNDGFWHQKRADHEILLYQNKLKSASKAGKASAKARQIKASERPLNDRCKSVEPNIKQETLNTKQETTIKTLDQSEIDQCFEMFWKSGIRKVNKKKSKPIFEKHLKQNHCVDGPTIYDLTSALINDVKTRLNSNQLGFTEMHPTTYLNGERWNDEVTNEKTTTYQRNNETPTDRSRVAADKLRRQEASYPKDSTLVQINDRPIR